jgi:hypothetical protein
MRPIPTEVTVAPAYCTTLGLSNAMKGLSDLPTSTRVHVKILGGMLGYDQQRTDSLVASDCALCIRSGGGWSVISVYSLLGLVQHNIRFKREDADKRPWFSGCPQASHIFSGPWTPDWFYGKNMCVCSRLNGMMSTVFEHKLADGLSLPFDFFALGPTLTSMVARECKAGPCDPSDRMDVLVAPLYAVLQCIDRNIDAGAKAKAKAKAKLGPAEYSWGFVCGSDLIDPQSVSGAFLAKDIRHRKLPPFVPVLQPPSVCGPALKKLMEDAGASVWDQQDTEDAAYMTSSCVQAPYKLLMKNALDALMRAPSGSAAKRVGTALT